MTRSGIHIYIGVFLAFAFVSCGFIREDVDLIVHNAKIRTADPLNPEAEAFAVRDGKILEIGAERRILNRYRAKEMLDAARRSVYPGLIDAHAHFLGYGLDLAQANLVGCSSVDEMISRLKAHHETYPAAWVLGRGWDQNRFDPPVYPTRDDLDAAFPNTPVYLVRVDGHAAVVNSEALRLAGIEQPQPIAGGDFLIENRRLTGVLIDNAMETITSILPPASRDERIRALREAQSACFKEGLTTIGDAGLSRADIELIDSLHRSGDLTMQLYVMVSATPDNIAHFIEAGPFRSERLNVRSFKFYADGALGSRGACLLEPYSDRLETAHKGFLLTDLDEMERIAHDLKDAGFQINTHCIGDSANRAVLKMYGRVLGSSNDLRWRIEHAQVVHKQDLPMFSAFTIIPSVQPVHATSDMYWAEQRLGRNRIRRAYAYKSLLEQNGMLALGTDFPVEEISPLNTYYAAVVRKDHKGIPKGGFLVEERLSPMQALYGMTLWAAMAQFEEDEKGSLSVGKNADFIVLDRDLIAQEGDEILRTRVIETRIRGERVYLAE